jgi:hypothetical protein
MPARDLVLFNADLLGCIFEYFKEKSYLSMVMVNHVFASSYRRHFAYVHRRALKEYDVCVSDVSWYCTSVRLLDWCLEMRCDASCSSIWHSDVVGGNTVRAL